MWVPFSYTGISIFDRYPKSFFFQIGYYQTEAIYLFCKVGQIIHSELTCSFYPQEYFLGNYFKIRFKSL